MRWANIDGSTGDDVAPTASLSLAGKYEGVYAILIYDGKLEILAKGRICDGIPHCASLLKA